MTVERKQAPATSAQKLDFAYQNHIAESAISPGAKNSSEDVSVGLLCLSTYRCQ